MPTSSTANPLQVQLARALALRDQALLVGVDGGASGFRAYEIVVRETARGPRLCLGEHASDEPIEPLADFTALSIERQEAEARAGTFTFSPEEVRMQGRWIHAAARAIARIAAERGRSAVWAGLCSPGIKTADGKGIAVALNGPRIPDFVEALEHCLELDGVSLLGQGTRLQSDGLACGYGEELAEEGAFAEVEHAYYLGGGSGVAECYKLDGALVAADALAPGIRKAWQCHAGDGRSFETHLSAAGLNRDFQGEARPAPDSRRPEEAAAAGDPDALRLFASRASRLAEWCAGRLRQVFEHHGVVLERIVVGQRLGQLLLDPRLETSFAGLARRELAARIQGDAPAPVRAAWLELGELRHGRWTGSSLRAAPAIGALAMSFGEA